MENLIGLILAGGSGSRLWPMSRELYPKQLLKLNSKNSLLQNTFLRLKNLTAEENILTLTNTKHQSDIKMQLGQITNSQIKILTEPSSKNTAPAIAIGVDFCLENNPDAIFLVVPSDHLIVDEEKFASTVQKGYQMAKENYIVTFGIKPCCADTGYGYIKTSVALSDFSKKVDEFKEKPDEKTAQEYLESGNYFWNSGIFMFKGSTMVEQMQTHCPQITNVLKEIDYNESQVEYDAYEKMPNISIDYAVMEKSDKIALVPLESDWNDLGSWQSIYDMSQKDASNNVTEGNIINVDSTNSLLYSGSKCIAAVGLDNVVIVETEDAILACDKDKTQDVKKVFDELKKQHSDLSQIHKTVFRPWGFYTCIEGGEGYLIKKIQVNPQQKLSIQLHNHRSEHWVVISGNAKVVLDNDEYMLTAGQSIDIPLKAKHSLQNPFDEPLSIIEVQKGDYIAEDDIIRFEDMYGRV
ncbi:MAG: mannose-1-phosphate guanylyltransferase/mannose-6-phosphate isomerase [Candidatus Gastranaerophilales bacterium]|nr:mannose-1-phosphate guanylyltransferase/mannose-6-phosphate isomerase [Candidatus Gastranaerophilales bacterium]